MDRKYDDDQPRDESGRWSGGGSGGGSLNDNPNSSYRRYLNGDRSARGADAAIEEAIAAGDHVALATIRSTLIHDHGKITRRVQRIDDHIGKQPVKPPPLPKSRPKGAHDLYK